MEVSSRIMSLSSDREMAESWRDAKRLRAPIALCVTLVALAAYAGFSVFWIASHSPERINWSSIGDVLMKVVTDGFAVRDDRA